MKMMRTLSQDNPSLIMDACNNLYQIMIELQLAQIVCSSFKKKRNM